MGALVVMRDSEGLRAAAMEIFELSLRQPEIERALKSTIADDPERLGKMLPALQHSPGYGDYVSYLLWLKDLRQVAAIELTADEADGLTVVEAARAEFLRKHPACPKCGTLQYSGRPLSCRACMTQFQ